jgi:hypothetical protein
LDTDILSHRRQPAGPEEDVEDPMTLVSGTREDIVLAWLAEFAAAG